MSIESEVAALTTATTALITAVGTQQLGVTAAVGAIAATTNRVNALNLVDNTHDADKPVSTAALTALNAKQATLVSGVNISTVNGLSLLGGEPLIIVRSATSHNTMAYADRGAMRSTFSEVDDSTVIEGLGLFLWVASKLEPDDDETCFTTSAGQWLLAIAAPDLAASWNYYEDATTEEWREDESLRFSQFLINNK